MTGSLSSIVRQNLGWIAAVQAVGVWLFYYALLLFGGLDPTPETSRFLQQAILFCLLASLLTALLAAIAIIKDFRRIAGVFALIFSLLFLLMFTGAIFMFVPILG